MHHARLARRYAAALMTAAEQQNATERITNDLAIIAQVIHDSREFRVLLASPVVSAARKRAILHDLFEKRVNSDTLSFIDLLVEKHREPVLGDIIEEFKALYDRKRGIVNVDVVSAVELTAAQQKELKAQLERYTQRNVVLQAVIDRAITGGLLIRIGDTVLDGSVRHQLEVLRERFAAAPVTE